MIDHDESPSPMRQVLCGLYQLWQRDGEFVPRYRLLRVRIQAPVAHRTVGRITHDSTERTGGEKRRHLADIALDDAETVLQAIAGDILLREHGQRALEFQPNQVDMRKTTCQKERHNPTAGAEVNEWGSHCSRDKIRQ